CAARRFVLISLFSAMVVPVYAARPAEKAKNVILMICDGAGFNAWQAASHYQHGRLCAEPFEDFPVHVGCTTYMLNYVDRQGRALFADAGKVPRAAVGTQPQRYDPQRMWRDFNYAKGTNSYIAYTDSAAACTALYTGSKTTRGRIAMNWNGKTELRTIAQIADALGKSTGTISSVQVSHATPGGVWAHNPNRENFGAIFKEMVYRSGLDVIMGAGHPLFGNGKAAAQSSARTVSSVHFKYVGDKRAWDDLSDADGAGGFRLVQRKEDFEAMAAGSGPNGEPLPGRVVGLAQVHDTLQLGRDGRRMAPHDPKNDHVPALSTMSKAALNVLAQDPEGFFLMVEGGAVDWANHQNNLERMIEELTAFKEAIQAVADWVEANSSWDETLLIVTCDHECGMLWGASTYTDCNNNGQFDVGVDRFGSWQRIRSRGKGVLPGHQYGSGGHTTTLVPLWAIGAGSQRFATLVDGVDRRAAAIWCFSGKYVDNTDVFAVMNAAMSPGAP
ncbi:MAG: hypothetical protein A2V70_04200, partial [Planctomycetes bacterium RBG_13_63_9]